ncbi:helix-turn-helix domain-containing protein [Actinomadura fulvescens]|uniref:TetR/AcrR family transcriptional regulator n=1 Tax=Actinomadura fulvescens TaxID=46160 RepID=A0ABN3QU21_9ACTN
MDDAPARPMRADARRNYQRLLAAAQALVCEEGTDASLEEIARRAGLGIGTLYRHFPTREALLETLLREHFEAMRARAEQLLRAPDPLQALIGWLRTFSRGTSAYRGLADSMMAALRDETSRLHASCQGMRGAGQDLLVRAQAAGAVRPDVTTLDLFLYANAAAWAAERVPADPEVGERFLRTIIDGLRTRTDEDAS